MGMCAAPYAKTEAIGTTLLGIQTLAAATTGTIVLATTRCETPLPIPQTSPTTAPGNAGNNNPTTMVAPTVGIM